MPADALAARGLRKRFGERVAVDGVDLRVAERETLALLGPNGAGKTTTVGMLTTMTALDGGSARVAGFDVAAQPEEVRRRIGVVFQGPSLELQLTARQNLGFHAALYGVPRVEAVERAEALLHAAGLAERGDEKVWKFSGGMRRRLEVVRAVLHRPRVLFLDEPTVGLDPQARLHTWDLLEQVQRDEGMAILLTTHDMHEAERLAQRVAIMDHGKVLDDASPARLKASLGAERIVLTLARRDDALPAKLAKVPGVLGAEWQGAALHVRAARAEQAVRGVLDVVERSRNGVEGMDLHRPTLEDVFIERTGRGLRDRGA